MPLDNFFFKSGCSTVVSGSNSGTTPSGKIGFDYLPPGGNLIFYRLFPEPLVGESPDRAVERQIKKLSNLAAGDFKVVRDRHLFLPEDDLNHAVLIEALEQEAGLKSVEEKKRSIGF